jgi:tetratricopeptide (TPR) repeat protein
MKKLIRQVRRLLEEKNLESPEEIDECIKKLDLSPDSELFSQPVSPLEQAQDLVREAWDLPSRKRRCNLAKRALEISPDCADAYLLLAEEETSRSQKAKDLYQKAVAAAERIIGPGMLRDAHGHFWGVPETRPYMRARAALAQFLWETGERDAAIDHYNALLELNSNDNQGLRYILTGWLLEEGRDEDLNRLLKRFPDDCAATWQYDRALHFFRQEGPGKKAQKALRDALKQNPFVPDYLLGEKKLPRSLPALIDMGDESEAIDYADRAIPTWQKTPYALDWLRENTPATDS